MAAEKLYAWRSGQVLRRLKRKNAKVLDIGCGRGLLLRAFQQNGCDVTGTEFSEGACRFAREVLKLPVRVGLLQGALSIEVLDNGPGFPAGFSLAPSAGPNGRGYGLRNVAERLRGYYGDSALLQWENGAEGTRVLLRIPPRILPSILK